MQGIRKIFETGLEDTWVSGLPGCAKPSSGAGWGGEAWCPGRGPCGLNGGKREREREPKPAAAIERSGRLVRRSRALSAR